MTKIFALLALCVVFSPAALAARQKELPAAGPARSEARLPALAPEGKNCALPDGAWFVWDFVKRPALGTAMVRVRVFDKAGGRADGYEFIGELGMPSMPYRGSVALKFQPGKNGDHLLPLRLTMPGEWQLVIRVRKNRREIFAGRTTFPV